jgi:hypothetical protein
MNSARFQYHPFEASAMYRIRLASGDETTFQSMDEFAAALQGGTVTAEALIYHQRADRWLSVTNHPHYQIALSRAQTQGAKIAEASKRQVIPAVRPAGEVPATRVGPSAGAPVAGVPRKLTIPAKKPESTPSPAPAAPAPPQGNGSAARTTVLPLRTPAKPSEPKVPDLGEGLDLVEVESAPAEAADAAPKRVSTATPQVDKLLEMLEPTAPAAPKPAATNRVFDVEVLDLGAPMVKPTAPSPSLGLELEPAVAPAPAVPVRRRQGNQGKMIGLFAAAALAIAAVMFVWKPWSSKGLPKGTEIASTTLPRTEAFGGSTANPAPTTAQISGSPSVSPSAVVDSGRSAKPVDSAPAIVRVAAPRNMGISVPTANLVASNGGAGLNIGATELIQHYNAAYNEARSELELRMLQIGFTQIFLRSRLATASGVQDTRRLIGSASSALRQYRSQENQIERSYQDTIGVAGRNLGWTPRDLGTWNLNAGQKEAGETLRLTNLMLSQMDSTFSLLAEQEGKYQISGDAITFQNPEAARQYGALRVWLNQQADKYSGSGDALPATLRQVVKAIGSTRLPQERR